MKGRFRRGPPGWSMIDWEGGPAERLQFVSDFDRLGWQGRVDRPRAELPGTLIGHLLPPILEDEVVGQPGQKLIAGDPLVLLAEPLALVCRAVGRLPADPTVELAKSLRRPAELHHSLEDESRGPLGWVCSRR